MWLPALGGEEKVRRCVFLLFSCPFLSLKKAIVPRPPPLVREKAANIGGRTRARTNIRLVPRLASHPPETRAGVWDVVARGFRARRFVFLVVLDREISS